MPNANLGYNTNQMSTHVLQTGMNSATAPAQLILNDRSQSTNLLNSTATAPIML